MKLQKRNVGKKSIKIKDISPRREITKEVLKGLALGGLVVASFALPNLPQIFSILGISDSRDRYAVKRAIKSLKKQKLIEIFEKDDEQIVKITENGKKRVVRYKFDEMTINRPPKWDGLWRAIAFDIPEKHKQGRDALTRKLKEMEFYPLQKSFFVCPFECKDEIDFIGEIFEIRKYINFLKIKSLDGKDEDFLKRHYDLD